ncbi:MAG: hypothetical protein QW112_02275 [Candidatus Micrarchaeia archaeon]
MPISAGRLQLRILFMAVLFQLLFIGSSYSQAVWDVFGYQVQSIGTMPVESCLKGCAAPDYLGWLEMIAIAGTAVFAVIAIIFMIGRVMSKPEYEALAKMEMLQTVNALIWIFVILLPFITFSCSATCYIAGGDPYSIGQGMLQNLNEKIEGEIIYMIGQSQRIRYAGYVSILMPPSTSCLQGICMAPFQGCAMLGNTYEMVVHLPGAPAYWFCSQDNTQVQRGRRVLDRTFPCAFHSISTDICVRKEGH